MNESILLELEKLNGFLKTQPWFDFELWELSGHRLKIVGALDLTYAYSLAVTFVDVFYMQLARSWHTDTGSDAFVLCTAQEAYDLNASYEIEEGYTLIRINAEDVAPFFISAKEMQIELKKIDRVSGRVIET